MLFRSDNLVKLFCKSNSAVGTLIKKIGNNEELFNSDVVKVVIDEQKNAMYFSRNPIPFLRDIEKNQWLTNSVFWKHIGIYVYKSEILEKFVNLPRSNYEKLEKLEQLRLLEQGAKFLCVETKSNLIGVDTQEDLEKVKYFI